jgi:hypothetical protein
VRKETVRLQQQQAVLLSDSPGPVFAADQFGSGFALVKSDIGNNIEVRPVALHGC